MTEEPVQPKEAEVSTNAGGTPLPNEDIAAAVARLETQFRAPEKEDAGVVFETPTITPETLGASELPQIQKEENAPEPTISKPTLKEKLFGGSVVATPTPETEVQKPNLEPVPPTPQPTPADAQIKPEQGAIRRLRTFKEDTQFAVAQKKASVVSIAAAESKRRAEQGPAVGQITRTIPFKSIFVIFVSLLFVSGGGAALWYVFGIDRSVAPAEEVQPTALIYADQAILTTLDGKGRTELMAHITDLRDGTNLSLGLIRELYFTLPNGAEQRRLATAAEFIGRIAPGAPSALRRSLDPEFFVGVHVFDGNQGLLLLRTSLYEQAFSGMLEWETSLASDVLPFMDRRSRPLTPSELEQLSTTTAPQVIPSGFTDAILQNRDVRVLRDERGEVALLYTFIDRKTILITTNDRTLTEVVSRVRNAPIQGL